MKPINVHIPNSAKAHNLDKNEDRLFLKSFIWCDLIMSVAFRLLLCPEKRSNLMTVLGLWQEAFPFGTCNNCI